MMSSVNSETPNAHSESEKSLRFGLIANTGYTIVALIFGLATGSLALIANATDGMVDSFTLAITFIGNRLGRRKATNDKSFGYGRATILAALINASIMVAVSISICVEALERLHHPRVIDGGLVAVIAGIGILVNGSVAYVLSKHRKDLSMRSVYLDNALDVVAAAATLITGLVTLYTHWHWLDIAVGLAIAILIIFNAYKILQEAVHILLEGTPTELKTDTVAQAIRSTEGVLQVDDMHIWAIRSGYNALSCHIAVRRTDLVRSRTIVEAVKRRLLTFDIHHATIEVELKEDSNRHHHEAH
jgi:cobalt-zinc-cadmium efflux system protein